MLLLTPMLAPVLTPMLTPSADVVADPNARPSADPNADPSADISTDPTLGVAGILLHHERERHILGLRYSWVWSFPVCWEPQTASSLDRYSLCLHPSFTYHSASVTLPCPVLFTLHTTLQKV